MVWKTYPTVRTVRRCRLAPGWCSSFLRSRSRQIATMPISPLKCAPQQVEDVRARDDVVGTLHHQCEQAHLLRCQLDGPPADADQLRGSVEHDVCDAQPGLGLGRRCGRANIPRLSHAAGVRPVRRSPGVAWGISPGPCNAGLVRPPLRCSGRLPVMPKMGCRATATT